MAAAGRPPLLLRRQLARDGHLTVTSPLIRAKKSSWIFEEMEGTNPTMFPFLHLEIRSKKRLEETMETELDSEQAVRGKITRSC